MKVYDILKYKRERARESERQALKIGKFSIGRIHYGMRNHFGNLPKSSHGIMISRREESRESELCLKVTRDSIMLWKRSYDIKSSCKIAGDSCNIEILKFKYWRELSKTRRENPGVFKRVKLIHYSNYKREG